MLIVRYLRKCDQLQIKKELKLMIDVNGKQWLIELRKECKLEISRHLEDCILIKS